MLSPLIRHRGFWGVVVLSLFLFWSSLTPMPLQNMPYQGPPAKELKGRLAAHKAQLACLTEAIYYEAGNQSMLGKEAVR